MEEGVRRLQPLLERLEAAHCSRGLAAVSAALASLYWLSGRAREALAAAARAADLARALGDRTLLATAEERSATALMSMGPHREEALRAAEEARRVAEKAGALEILGIALADVAMLYMDRGEFATSRVYWARAREALQQGDPLQIACATQNSGELAYYMGDWSQARADLERAVAMTHPLGSPWGTWFALFPLGQLCLAEGDWEAVSRYVEQARTIAEHMCDSLGRRREAQRLLAERDLLQGHPAATRARLVPLLGGPGVDETDVAVLALLAWAHLELGELAEAERVVAEALARMRADNNRLDLVDALRVQAMVVSRQERWAEADQSLEEGLTLARSMPYPYAEARLLCVDGEMHMQKEEPDQAWKRLEAALAIFRRLGARKDAERTEQAIADLPCPNGTRRMPRP
jgi:tetratricopeptide (TPR) repeat protein